MGTLIYMSPTTVSIRCKPSSTSAFVQCAEKPQVVGRYRDYYKIINGKLVEYGEPDALFLNDGQGNFEPVSLEWRYFFR